MALDISGIRNVEFYSEHYLEAVLENDLKDIFKRWSDAKTELGKPQPFETLKRQGKGFFKAMGKAESERDITTRWELAREFHVALMEALGFEYRPGAELVGSNEVCPVLRALEKDGKPFLWIVDAPFTEQEDDDPFDIAPMAIQLPENLRDSKLPHENSRKALTWREIFDTRLFRTEHAPRWVIYLAGREVYLVERNKWPQGRYLAFDLAELFRRSQPTALKAAAGLLHRDVLAPDTGVCLHDSLEEKSHKHAYAVSNDLKYGVRRAVELIGNEAIYYRREVQKQGVFDSEEFSEDALTRESLTWLYRLLFLFYVEARGGELGVVPMNAEIYREGYSLENLRDLELVDLASEHARNGYYLHDSLKILFKMINEGYGIEQGSSLSLDLEQVKHDSMTIQPLNSPLFDNSRFTVLKNIRIRNFVLQEILQLLSLSAEKKKKSRGRISYAQLGINQLGSVYEGLLSYTGFFAKEDLYEVAAEKDCSLLSGKSAAEREALKTYFVPTSRIADYMEGEIVKDENGKKVVHNKGTFIFRLAGRNREKSASYYTPEVLTRCVVKYALKELIWEEGEKCDKPRRKKTADEILGLTICEPAMGSSAFLIEAVEQLADAYLEVRQEERGEIIPPEDYQREKRRVKARLATNNCYGVDLNPTAVELAKVSLWLATLHEGGKCPWFDLRFATGNSLVGARREVFKTCDVTRPNSKQNPNWLSLVPEAVSLHHGEDASQIDEHWTAPLRPKGTIYHFLLPAEGMAAFDKDKVIKQLAPESVKRIKEWRKEFCKPFNQKDAGRLEQISDAVDLLFAQVVRERLLATQATSDRIPVWGEAVDDEGSAKLADLLVRDQEEVAASLEDGSSAYRRLKLAMDAWCALWFWPIEEVNLLPDRATWLAQMELILKGQVTHEEVWQQQGLFVDLSTSEIVPGDIATPYIHTAERLKWLQALSDAFCKARADYSTECGLADIDALLEGDANLRAVQRIADRLRFHHWELRFAEVLAREGGFGLMVGNPPWVMLSFNQGLVMSDRRPLAAIRQHSATTLSKLCDLELCDSGFRQIYVSEFEQLAGSQSFFGAIANYSLLEGQKANLYKCFLMKAFDLSAGVVGMIHPSGIFDHKEAGPFRRFIYPRLRFYFQFDNQLPLFSEILHTRKFTACIYGDSLGEEIHAQQICGLYHPSTIDACFGHDGLGSTPGRKTQSNEWELQGHRNRVVLINFEALGLFQRAFGEAEADPRDSRIPLVFSTEVLEVLGCFARQGTRVGGLATHSYTTQMWNEKTDQDGGMIVKQEVIPQNAFQWIVSGPHLYVGNPLYKTANEGCSGPLDYSDIDLCEIPKVYFPRSVYSVGKSEPEYRRRIPTLDGSPITDSFRVISRKMIDGGAERTLCTAIIPPEAAHIGGCLSITIEERTMLSLAWGFFSLPFDFWVKSTGKTNLYRELTDLLPILNGDFLWQWAVGRVLRLVSITDAYEKLWNRWFQEFDLSDRPAVVDRRVLWTTPGSWTPEVALRNHFSRRHSLVEIDCLAAMALGINLEDLVVIYRIQFPILQKNERVASFDQNGRVVPTSKTVSGKPAASLVELATTLKEQAGFDVHAEYHPDGSNTQELRRQKIRLGKKEADVLGVPERCTMADVLAETEVRWSDEAHQEGCPVRLVGLRYTDPGLEPRMERVYPTPWTRCDREADYRQAWAEFERRLGKKMPEGTPL